jgi:CrcB protein
VTLRQVPGEHGRPLGVVVAVVAVGGVIGAEARYGVARLVPHAPSSWPWATLLINIVGSALLGVLVAVLAGLRRPPALARPFLGVGVLGGFTTFSGYELDLHTLLRAHRTVEVLGYAAVSVLACVSACVAAGAVTTAVRRPPAPAG